MYKSNSSRAQCQKVLKHIVAHITIALESIEVHNSRRPLDHLTLTLTLALTLTLTPNANANPNLDGGAENAGVEKLARSKLQD